MRSFIEVLPTLRSEFPGHNIIIRPHPSENFDTWRSQADGLRNVFVVHEGDVIPWLLAASVSIHNGCTTGLQGFLLERPVVSYMHIRSGRFDKDLPNSVSRIARSREQLIGTVASILTASGGAGSEAATERKRIAEHHISGMSGRWASDRVMDALEELEIGAEVLKASAALAMEDKTPQNVQLTGIAGAVRSRLRRMLPNARPPVRTASQSKSYALQTFPTLDIGVITRKLQNLQRASGRFSRVQVGQIAENVFCLFPSDR